MSAGRTDVTNVASIAPLDALINDGSDSRMEPKNNKPSTNAWSTSANARAQPLSTAVSSVITLERRLAHQAETAIRGISEDTVFRLELRGIHVGYGDTQCDFLMT